MSYGEFLGRMYRKDVEESETKARFGRTREERRAAQQWLVDHIAGYDNSVFPDIKRTPGVFIGGNAFPSKFSRGGRKR